MIAKGHDIPNVTLVGVVSADVGIGMPDFRAAERTFQILTQVAGRAGRGHLPGMVYMQTINPDHYAIKFAAQQDYNGFFEKELQFRRFMKYPPFCGYGEYIGSGGEAGGCVEDEHGTGAPHYASAREYANYGTGGGACAAIEGGVSVSVADQVGQPEGFECAFAEGTGFCACAEVERDGAGD